MVAAYTLFYTTVVKVWRNPALTGNCLLIHHEDAKQLEVTVQGIEVIFPSIAHQVQVNDQQWLDDDEDQSQEEQWDDESVKLFIQSIDDALKENQKLQENSHCVLPGSEFKISLKENTPKFVPQYPIPEKLKEKVMKQVNKWVKKGFVKKWDKDKKNLWNSPLLAVSKKSGGQVDPDDIRVCLDLRAVNALTKDPNNILSSPAELFEHVQGMKYFTEINLTEAYHYIVMSEKSQPLLGFLTPDKSQYVYVRMSFGLKGAVTHFQVQGE